MIVAGVGGRPPRSYPGMRYRRGRPTAPPTIRPPGDDDAPPTIVGAVPPAQLEDAADPVSVSAPTASVPLPPPHVLAAAAPTRSVTVARNECRPRRTRSRCRCRWLECRRTR